jgi:alkaline phosphatase D
LVQHRHGSILAFPPKLRFLGCVIRLFVAAFSSSGLVFSAENPLEKIAFVSCFKESRPSQGLASIAEWEPEVFIWMGDNIYGDSADVAVLEEKYQQVKENASYLEILKKSKVLATWDDHDYGKNDAGKEFPAKEKSQRAFLDFLNVPEESPRRGRQGVYDLQDFGPEGKQVRVILLDTRYFRDPIGSNGDLLGEAQWEWLGKALRESPAEVNLLVSSIQVLASEHRFEKWENFPKEKERLLALLNEEDVPPVVILSGDRHLAEISRTTLEDGSELYDVTSSSLNSSFGGDDDEVNRLRIGPNFGHNNYGTLKIDWSEDSPEVTAVIHDEAGAPQLEEEITLSEQ